MIYLMRHGADPDDRLGGWSNYGLTETGIQQVKEAVAQLKNKGIEQIYASDLARAKETAAIIAAELDLDVSYLPQFREGNNGELAGMLKSKARKKYPGVYWNTLDWTQSWAGGESPEQFFLRIKKAWQEFKTMVTDKNVLLVSHGGVMNVILCLENGITYTNKETSYRIKHAGIVAIAN